MNDQRKKQSRRNRIRVVAFSGIPGYQSRSTYVVARNIIRELRNRRIAVLDVPVRVPKWFQWIRPKVLAGLLLRYIVYPWLAFRCWCRFGDRAVYFAPDHASALLARAIPRRGRVIILVQDLASMMPLRAIPFRKTWRTYLIHVLGVLFKRRGIYRADHIVTGAAAIRGEVIRWLKKQPHEVTVVYDGFDEKTFVPGNRAQARQAMTLRQEESYVLSVASSQPRKNISCLIEAMRELRGRIENAKLLYVGNFDHLAAELIEKHKLNDAIIRFQNISDADLAQLYRSADVYAFPSQYEGFGLPAVEAMACGCPVVTSAAPTLLEVVGGCGLATPTNDSAALADAMESVICDKAVADQLTESGLQRVKMFYWSKTAERLETVFAKFQNDPLDEDRDADRTAANPNRTPPAPCDETCLPDRLGKTTA